MSIKILTRAGLSIGLAVLGAALVGCAQITQADAPAQNATPSTTATVPAHPAPVPAPTTAQGYTSMFADLDPAEWAAADVSISVRLPEGRSVWLFGDTAATRSFVHSTAIIQDGGRLTVSQHGRQLLPNDDASHIYWIESAKLCSTPNTLAIKARAITLVGQGPWDFRDGGYDRIALVTVSKSDVIFDHWLGKTYCQPPDPGPIYQIDSSNPHHFGYARHAHPECTLASGKTLVTTCQNWDDGMQHPFAEYRPIFSEE